MNAHSPPSLLGLGLYPLAEAARIPNFESEWLAAA
jgi:hypothetical protein